MKKSLALVALAAVLASGWMFASPYWTLHQMRKAAVARDAAAVSAFVDFPALREDLKADFTVAMMAEAAKNDGDPMHALGVGLGTMMVGGMVEQFVSPAGVEMLLAGERTEVFDPKKVEDLEIVRDGLSRFRLRSASDPEKAAIIFTRRGLSWVITGVDLPPEALATTS
jgi:hypothetical protein